MLDIYRWMGGWTGGWRESVRGTTVSYVFTQEKKKEGKREKGIGHEY